MRVWNITPQHKMFIGPNGQQLRLPVGDSVAIEEVSRALNEQSDLFLRWYEGAEGALCYTYLTGELEILKGRFRLQESGMIEYV